MNQEVKELWVEALTSGKYKKGRNYLQKGGKFCCLGVLCELAIENGVAVQVSRLGDGQTAYDDHDGSLPDSVSRWAGLSTSDDPSVAFGGVDTPLAGLNDGNSHRKPKPFRSIAKLIREQL